MLDIMFEIPSKTNVKECVITEEVITSGAKPELVLGRENAAAKTDAAKDKDKDSESESA